MSLRADLEKLSVKYWSNDKVCFRPIKTQNDILYAVEDCQLEDEQKDLVNPAWLSIGRAYLSPEDNYPCIIRNEKREPIGFINLAKWLGKGDEHYSWSFLLTDGSRERDMKGKPPSWRFTF